jgi:hypothetical protein
VRLSLLTSVAAFALLALPPVTGAWGHAHAGYSCSVGCAASDPTEWGEVVNHLIRGETHPKRRLAAGEPCRPAEPPTPAEEPAPANPSPRAPAGATGCAGGPSPSSDPEPNGLGSSTVPPASIANESLFQRGCSSRPQGHPSRLFRPPRA